MSLIIRIIITTLSKTWMVLFFAATLFFLTNCGQPKCDVAPDVSEIEANIKIERFDQDFFNIDTTNIEASMDDLYKKYPEFADFYSQVMLLKEEGERDSAYYINVNSFLNFDFTRNAYDTVQQVYGDVSDIEMELSDAYKYLKHYLPNVQQPRILAMHSELTNYMMIPPFENMYVVDFEYFFGVDYKPYYMLPTNPVPRYIARTQNRDHLPAKILDGIIQSDLIPDSTMQLNTLLDYMILNGKRLYLLEKILPCTPDSVIFNYTKAQTKFVKDNEFKMWREVFSGKIYDTDYVSFQKYIGPSPNSPEMPMEAPGNTGSFVGYKIIEAFMKRNPNYSMEDLIKTSDSKEILIKSRYKPKK